MKTVIQRVKKAGVIINGETVGKINKGLLVLLAISAEDTDKQIDWMANKLVNLRIFSDENRKMNHSVLDIGGEMLVVSNFTLYGSTRKGFRPSYSKSAAPEIAIPLYNQFIEKLETYPINIQTGVFGEMMDVELINDGPVTLIIDTEELK